MSKYLLRTIKLSLARRQIFFPGAHDVGRGIRGYHEDNKYSQLSDETLEDLSDKFDALLETNPGADVSLNNGVLTIVVDENSTYVINKQTPNRQLWFSSPLSGPKRFDLDNASWVERKTHTNLYDILSEEFSFLLQRPVTNKLRLAMKQIDPQDRNIIIFPGADNVRKGLGTGLLCIKEAEETYKRANDLLKFDLLSLCLRGPNEHLVNNLQNRHLAAFVTSHASLAKLEHDYPKSTDYVSGVTGEDVGMFNSLVFANCLTFEKALELVKLRAQALVKASEIIPSAQILIKLRPATQKHKICLAAERHCIGLGIPEEIAVCSITKYLGRGRIQLGGHLEAIKYLTEEGARLFEFRDFKILPDSSGYNTKLMRPVEELLDRLLKTDDLKYPDRCRVYSMSEGNEYKNVETIRRDLISHVCRPIKFEQTIQCIYKRDRDLAQPNTYVMWDRDMLKYLDDINGRAKRAAKLIK